MEQTEVIAHVNELISSYLEQNGIELVEVIYRREGPVMMLRLLVDKPEGIKLGECEELNNYLSELLDRESVIDEHYTLEVASPGLDRPITSERDFRRVIGKELDVTTYEAIDGRKTHEGTLVGTDEENVVIESDGISIVIPRNKIARARLKIKFE